MNRLISRKKFTNDPTRYVFDVFESHEPILMTDHGMPIAIIEPSATRFPVTITQEQPTLLRARYGIELSPPQLVERAVAERTGNLDE